MFDFKSNFLVNSEIIVVMGFMDEAEDEKKTSYAFNIRTDAMLGERICKEAERRGESASFVFREAVRQYLARVERSLEDDL